MSQCLVKIIYLMNCYKVLGPLLRTGLPLMKNVIKPVAKSVLETLG